MVFAEYLRRDNFLEKHKDIKLFKDEVFNKIKEDNFILLVFGSTVEFSKPRDIDVLLIVDSTEKIEFHEKFLHNIASNYDMPFEKRVIGFESVYECFQNETKEMLLMRF